VVLVLDINEPLETIKKKNSVCLETIERIGASGVPLLTAMNKIDRLHENEAKEKLEALEEHAKNPILISALRRTNLDQLRREIRNRFEKQTEATFTITLTTETPKFLSWIHTKANVKKEIYSEGFVEVVFEGDPSFVEGVRKRVEEFEGTFSLIAANTSQ